jgi:hypothetical protein
MKAAVADYYSKVYVHRTQNSSNVKCAIRVSIFAHLIYKSADYSDKNSQFSGKTNCVKKPVESMETGSIKQTRKTLAPVTSSQQIAPFAINAIEAIEAIQRN